MQKQEINMKIFQLLIYLFISCQTAETLDQLTDLGQNVTINCDLDSNEVYWILLKQSDSHTVILRSFSKSAHYFNKTFKKKYSVQSKHRLVIYNITVDELGVYYCMNKDTPPKLSTSTRLHIIKPTELTKFSLYLNETLVKCIQHNETQWHFIIIISALLNALIIVITVVSCYSKERLKLQDTDLQQTKHVYLKQHEEMSRVQYTAVRFSTCEESEDTRVI
ncbi:uncharacterized protein [Paramisgurnus dabryanus]|uniref:uncharacterized protein n=1 Tax=Paramisgurnus dabryanus TaxID=90735 RepID=UPI0031F3F55E